LTEPALVGRAFLETAQPIPLGPLDVGCKGSRAGDLGKDLSRVIIYVSVPVQLRHLSVLRHLSLQGCHWLQ